MSEYITGSRLLLWLTCYNMTEEHLPEGLVLASEQLEEEGMQLCCCQLQDRRSLSVCAVLQGLPGP